MVKARLRKFGFWMSLGLLLWGLTSSYSEVQAGFPPSHSIMVDQFGYRPQDHKVAVIVNPQSGFNAHRSFSPGRTYQVRGSRTDNLVYSGTIEPWANGKTHSQSGDQAWWFDFSALEGPGSYYIFDPKTGQRSFPFEVRRDVYRPVLVAATRMFFYQRSGFAKEPPYVEAKWADEAAFLQPGQDSSARDLYDRNNPRSARDMRGGWFDAGDTNKYVTFANQPVHQLLTAYTQNPKIWTDDFNIPESGNRIPDLIDEIKFELDWLQRMQDQDGGVFIKLGNIDYNDAETPSQDQRPRYYAPKCSSATIAAASMFAHGALVFQQFDALKPYARILERKALNAQQWYQENPKRTDCDSQEIKAGDADINLKDQEALSVVAAIYLFALDPRQEQYTTYIRQHLTITQPFLDDTWSRYRSIEGDALLFYAQLPGVDPEIKNQILVRFKQTVESNRISYGFNPRLDPYRAPMPNAQYHWGSNAVQANYGNTNVDVVRAGIDPLNWETYQIRALDHLHYLQGVNPLSLVYLTNMSAYGAENSANEMYHSWLGKGIYDNALKSSSGPAPGYLTGGANKNYTGSEKWVKVQPPMKAYIDKNDPQIKAWEINEPGIYYQSAYLKLLSNFIN
ncbi:MAG: glycoside hydrolase family 9 [Oscillatoriales cyanobacterium RM2_1_1]|nr:glycoside hydrolase family 9 [Oscillatoriales cyanobacterium SM2_3_0]NJO46788.1 glycoside hydrolase family 9 [Oscillatoriales cyanobacterium RM2_1_1]